LVDDALQVLPEIVSDPYRPPPPGREERHHGVDFAYFNRHERASIEDAGIQSVLNGWAAVALPDTFPYGNLVIIETPAAWLPPELAARINLGGAQSLYVLYAHMKSAPLIVPGSAVEACQALGAVGRSGNAGGAHLHLETRLGPPGMRFASIGYYLAKSTPEERENYLLWRTSGTFQHFDPLLLLLR
jgi:murein DD-endopeptidase MepM/ murein hydrolase activator NlpD